MISIYMVYIGELRIYVGGYAAKFQQQYCDSRSSKLWPIDVFYKYTYTRVRATVTNSARLHELQRTLRQTA